MEPQGNNTTQEQVATKLEAQSTPKRSQSVLDITVKGTSFVVFVLLIVGIAIDKLNTYSEYGVDSECTWDEIGEKGFVSDDWIWAKYDNDDLETAGKVWLAFGILGIVAQAVAIGSMIVSEVVLTSNEATINEAIFRLGALVIACAFVVIQWSVWKAKGCSDGNDNYDMGVSMILVIIAWALNVVATGLQAVNTMAIMPDSSGSPAKQADLEDGANIRS